MTEFKPGDLITRFQGEKSRTVKNGVPLTFKNYGSTNSTLQVKQSHEVFFSSNFRKWVEIKLPDVKRKIKVGDLVGFLSCEFIVTEIEHSIVSGYDKAGREISGWKSKCKLIKTLEELKAEEIAAQKEKDNLNLFEKDLSKYKAFPGNYNIPIGVEVIIITTSDDDIGMKGVVINDNKIKWADGIVQEYKISEFFAPINPADHPNHPTFNNITWVKQRPFPEWYEQSLNTVVRDGDIVKYTFRVEAASDSSITEPEKKLEYEHGKYYFHKRDNWDYYYIIKSGYYHLSTDGGFVNKGGYRHRYDGDIFRLATEDEILWLDLCSQAGYFIPKPANQQITEPEKQACRDIDEKIIEYTNKNNAFVDEYNLRCETAQQHSERLKSLFLKSTTCSGTELLVYMINKGIV